MTGKKKPFPKPELFVHGNVEELTKGNADGTALDADFADGTPRGRLGFSG